MGRQEFLNSLSRGSTNNNNNITNKERSSFIKSLMPDSPESIRAKQVAREEKQRMTEEELKAQLSFDMLNFNMRLTDMMLDRVIPQEIREEAKWNSAIEEERANSSKTTINVTKDEFHKMKLDRNSILSNSKWYTPPSLYIDEEGNERVTTDIYGISPTANLIDTTIKQTLGLEIDTDYINSIFNYTLPIRGYYIDNMNKLGISTYSSFYDGKDENGNPTYWESPSKSTTWDDYTFSGMSRGITNNIIDRLPKDDNGNIIIGGSTFTEYEAYRHIYPKVTEQFHNTLLDNSDTGFGHDYINFLYKREFGISYDDFVTDELSKRLKEIRVEAEALRDEYVDKYYDKFSNETEAGMNAMNVMLPQWMKESISDFTADMAIVGPFDDLLEHIDAIEAAGGFEAFKKGYISGFDWEQVYTLGWASVLKDVTKLGVLDKVNNGEPLSEGEQYWYKLVQLEQEYEELCKSLKIDKSTWASIGEGVGSTVAEAPAFAISMWATGGIGSGVKYGTKTVVKQLVKDGIKTGVKKYGKKLAWTAAKDAAKWGAVNYARGFAAAPITSFTYKSYTESALEQYSFDENGDLVFTPKDEFSMWLGAYIDGANEIASEHFGEGFGDAISLGSKAFGRATGISKWLLKSDTGTAVRRALQAPMSAATKKTLKNLGYTGILSEPLSEVYGDFSAQVMKSTAGLLGAELEGDYSNFTSADYWLTTMGVSTIYGGPLASISAGGNIVREAKYAKQIYNDRKTALNNIGDEELKNALSVFGDSENFVESAIGLADFFKTHNITSADKVNALHYMRNSYVLMSTLGDMQGYSRMEAYSDRIHDIYNRTYKQDDKSSGRVITAFDKADNEYNIISGDFRTQNSPLTVVNSKGEIITMSSSELEITDIRPAEDIILEEFDDRFSASIEAERLNAIRGAFESMSNPTESDIKRVAFEYNIIRPEVGDSVTLVDGSEATILENLHNGKYSIETLNSNSGELETIEIPIYSILSNYPLSASAQKKMYEDAKKGYEEGNQQVVREAYSTPEEKANNIIFSDYDSKLFDEQGKVRTDKFNSIFDTVFNNFSFEDPSILEEYIKNRESRLSSGELHLMNNALTLSKINREINSIILQEDRSRSIQSSMEELQGALRYGIERAPSFHNYTVEQVLDDILAREENFNPKVLQDIRAIKESYFNNKAQQQSTTKTKTSVTQKDVKGKKGRKTIESSLKRFRQAVKQDNIVKALYEINFIDETRKKTDDIIITDEELNELEEARKTFKERGYEIKSLKGTNYHEGQTDALVEEFIKDTNLPAGTAIVTEVITPAIYKDGQLYKAGKVKVAMGPEIEEETPDISQAVTKEMTEEEPMDFSEPTDNTVEPKKEDSIPQTPTEQEFTIPELEKVFAVPDSDKLIETPSREEEVETLTDEQRNQVRIHNENGTDLVDYISDSPLPDDPSTDEAIVDKHELQGNRIYRYSGEQLRNNQAQVRRTPNKEGDNHDLVYKWLDENSIDLQGIIDNELAAIASLDTDVKFMMMTEGTKSGYTVGSPMLNTIFQVVEYTDAIKKIHNEKRGGVITSNSKEYLLIGITGFSTPKPGIFNPEAAHYNFIADRVLKSARNSYTSQTDEISRDAYYVHPTMSTKIKNIEAGWIVTQTTEDSEKQSRSLGELLADETRNPHGITTENSKWLIPTRNSAKPIKVRVDANDTVHGLKIPTGLAGSLFLLVPASNGHYIPVSVKIQTTNKLVDGTLKDTIWEVAQNLLSTEKETRDYAIKELCKVLNLTKEGYNIFVDDSDIDFDNPNSAKIVFTQNGRRMATEISLNSPNASAELYNTIFSDIPFQLNIGLQTLVSGELQAYIDAGALRTDVALLGTTNASYTVHSVGPDLKADPYTENSTEAQEGSYENSDLRRAQDNGIINYGNNSYSVVAEGQYRNTITGELVTSAKRIREIETHIWLEESKPTPVKIEQGSKARLYIIGENEVISVSKKGIITFYSVERSGEIIDEINRENIEESRINNAVEELARIEEQQQAEQVIPQELQEEKEASVPEVNFTENFDVFNTPEASPVEDSFTEVSFEEAYSPKEKVSATFTEGVVENTDASQLYTDDYLGNIEEQLIAEGMSEEEINAFMDKILLQLEERGMGTYYTKDQESTIKTIVDNIKNCN